MEETAFPHHPMLCSAETLMVTSDFTPSVLILPCTSSHTPPQSLCGQGAYKVRTRVLEVGVLGQQRDWTFLSWDLGTQLREKGRRTIHLTIIGVL